ncbi:hypothetical protein ACOKFD_12585 [Flagellimonas sp. S174]|uniref:hypothetical protein n=1 Tax=Flagellimonas sp. S174 TaxID=3410790 RepID=UPI003BF4E3EA
MDKEVKEIINLGKDSIVQLALELIDEEVSTQNFTKINVMTNGEEVYVSLRNPIKYLPIKSIFNFDIGISILAKTVVYNPISNGVFDDEHKAPFYERTNEIDKNIEFVIESINKSTEVGSINTIDFDDDMIIQEHKNHYDVSLISKFQESSYKIEKLSGKIYDAQHAHLVPSPLEGQQKDKWKEIN